MRPRARSEPNASAVATRAGEDEARIFDAHLLFLQRRALLDPAREAIRDGARLGRARVARRRRGGRREMGLARRPSTCARGRSTCGASAPRCSRASSASRCPRPGCEAPGILVVADLTPADAAALDPATALGIVPAHGGPTSHAAVLARAIGIPAVVGVGPRVLVARRRHVARGRRRARRSVRSTRRPRSSLAFEAERSRATPSGSHDCAGRLEASRHARRHGDRGRREHRRAGRGRRRASPPARTASGCSVPSSCSWIARRCPTSTSRRPRTGRPQSRSAAGRCSFARSMPAPTSPSLRCGRRPEANPFLGVRGIRLGLARPELLLAQLRALLRVAADHPVRVMFPMIATVERARRGARGRSRPPEREVGVDARSRSASWSRFPPRR